ncbi:DUF2480 family protein [Fulvivirga sedimenti]|uniref:DUF2480 family protein n=1 Tax=Fulvivirga sedimenti TaxID=2879465 RepID=A0A9X1HZ15_9BACT|nr:DUF2480 family protein [Fulvivirga sedimenti]MCA6079237.1 DUF2480 family protein [Fulvivirga sedimenti]
MAETGEIVNRVEKSGLVTINLEEYYHPGERVIWDMADWLFQGLILREKDFRTGLKEVDWSEYDGKNVAITCSADAIIPTWAYMLVATGLEGHAHLVVVGTLETLEYALFDQAVTAIDRDSFAGARVVVKGCGKLPVPDAAYVRLSMHLKPVVASLMFGEPCSTVPVYKRPKG